MPKAITHVAKNSLAYGVFSVTKGIIKPTGGRSGSTDTVERGRNRILAPKIWRGGTKSLLNHDFTYCTPEGNRCKKRKSCIRYTKEHSPDDYVWWADFYGETKELPRCPYYAEE